MEFTRVSRQAQLLTLVTAVLGMAAGSHFRGAIIQWRPVNPDNFDGRVLFTHRIAWHSGSAPCDNNTVSEGNLIGPGGQLLCRNGTGCFGITIGSLQFQCTDFSVDEQWSAGQGSNERNLTGVVADFEASFTGGNWIRLVQGGGGWEIRVKGDLSPRADNGRINSSPTTAVPPVLRLRHGTTHTVTIPVSDADGDIVRCRWAESALSECASVCQMFPATLDQDNCRLTYIANGSLGWYAVAIQVEDFMNASSTVAMSSVPVQFLVHVQNITISFNASAPTFVGGTPVDGSCIPVNGTYHQQITARSGGDNVNITDISPVASPPGLMRSALTVLNSRESYITVTWTPSSSQQGSNTFCYTATDSFGLVSEQTCITLLAGVKAPEVIEVTLRSFGNSTFLLSLQFNQQIKRPSVSRNVRVFQADGMQVLSVDVSNSSDAVYFGNALSISTTTPFLSNRTYYLVADSGVAVATAFCGLESFSVTPGNDEFGSITLQVPPEVTPSAGMTSKTTNGGDPITISFKVVNEPAPSVMREGIQWVFSGSNGSVNLPCKSSPKYIFSSDCLSLTVNNTVRSDAGLYQIVVTTEAGTAMSSVVLSLRGVKPVILIPLANTTRSRGNTHMFVCAAAADPQPVFVFRFNGERIMSNSSKHTMITNSTHGTLTVFDLQGSDEGTYNCSISNRFGGVSTAAVLSVQVPPVLNLFPFADRDVVEGENLVASCRASGNPTPIIQWFRDNQLLSGSQSISISQRSNGISQLTVIGFANENVGMYSCVAVNNLGSDSKSFQVNAVVRPNITSITYSADGSDVQNLFHGEVLSLEEFTPEVRLTCEAYGSSPPEVTWLKDGIVLEPNVTDQRVITTSGGPLSELGNVTRSTLRLTEVQLSDAGEYTCRARSGNVSPIPGTTAWTFIFNIAELDECDPNPCQNNGKCVDGRQTYTCNCMTPPENGDILYTGRNCTTVVDNRIAPSVTASPSSVTVELNGRVTLSCSASGNPTPIIQWYKDNSAIEGPQAIGNTFVIQEATPGDRGFYHCEAFSSVGRSRSTEAALLVSGVIQFSIDIRFAGVGGTGSRRRRQAVTSNNIIETLRLQLVDQTLPVEGNLTATVYSVEPARDNSSELVITVLTNSTASPATLTNQVTQPLEQALAEVTDINQEISFAIVATERRDGCPELPASTCGNAGPVTWPETEIGQVASVPCPCGVSNDPLIQELRGTRRCGGTYDTGAMWEEPQCVSCQFSNTRLTLCRLAEIDSPALLATELVSATNNSEEIQSADVSLIVGLLSNVTNSSEDLEQEEVQMDLLSTVSNVQQVPADELAMSQERARSSSRLFDVVELVLNVVEVAPGDPFQFAAPEFGVHVEEPPSVLGADDFFTPNISGLFSQIMNISLANLPIGERPELPPAMVNLSSNLLSRNATGSRPSISVAIYGRDALFQERPGISANDRRATEIVGSIILDVSLRMNGTVVSISRPPNTNVVMPTFTTSMLARSNGSNPTCQFWNLTADDGFGRWDGSNCRVLRETDEEVECGCDHLTHFAILLDVNPDPPSTDPNATALTWVSYIGTILSVIALIITIVTYLAEKNLRKTVHSKLLMNLCFALVGLYVTFIISTVSTGVPVLCGVVSALMHYFFLAVFFWMAAEAIHLHRKLVTVFKPDIESYFAIALAICWVVPAIIVAFSLAPRYQNYIHSQFCRAYGYSFWIGLLVPFGIIYIMNWVIFILIFASLLCRPNVRKETSNKGNLRKLKENFTIALGLSLLFGMGWAVGLLASSDVHAAVRYPAEWIFTLMTAFLGVYLFLLYILRSSEARGFWMRWLLCQRKKSPFVGVSNTTSSRTRTGISSSTVASWWQSLKANILRKPLKDNPATNGSTLDTNPTSMTTNQYSSSITVEKLTVVASEAEHSSIEDSSSGRGTSPQVEIELVHKVDLHGDANNEEPEPSIPTSSELPGNVDAEMEYRTETFSFHDETSLKGFNSYSSTNGPNLSSDAYREDHTVESKQT